MFRDRSQPVQVQVFLAQIGPCLKYRCMPVACELRQPMPQKTPNPKHPLDWSLAVGPNNPNLLHGPILQAKRPPKATPIFVARAFSAEPPAIISELFRS